MNNPASDKQVAFIGRLYAERKAAIEAGSLASEYAGQIESGKLSIDKSTASALISQLMAIRPVPTAPPVAEAGGIEAGHYAIEVGGVVHFYRIDKPADGKWAGWTFVKRQYGDNYERLRGGDAKAVLEQIGTDPVAAMSRYGQEVGACGRCNRSLTDEESRKLGIGPECRKILALV